MSTSYRADVTREDGWWMIRVPDLELVTQAASWGEVEAMARGVIAAVRDVALDEIAVVLTVHPEPGVARLLDDARAKTETAERLCAEIHNRMPAIIAPEAWPAWLGEEPVGDAQLKTLLAPYPSDEMICWPVSARVGNVKNNDPSLIEPLAAS